MDVSIDSVIRIRLSEIERYDEEEGEEEEPYFRTLTIQTESGTLDLELASASRQALELIMDA